jgi:hypothetical protein
MSRTFRVPLDTARLVCYMNMQNVYCFEVIDRDDEQFDITGATVEFAIRKRISDVTPFILKTGGVIDGESGLIKEQIDPIDLSVLPPWVHEFYFSLKITKDSIIYYSQQGSFTIYPT